MGHPSVITQREFAFVQRIGTFLSRKGLYSPRVLYRNAGSEVVDSIQHLNGRVDEILYLVSVLVAMISPALTVPLLNRIGELKAKAQSEPFSAYEKGFSSVEDRLLQTVKIPKEAETVRDIKGEPKH